MRAIDRFRWMLKGVRWLPPEDDEPHTRSGCHASDLSFILGEARLREFDDLREAKKRGDERPGKRLGVITMGDLYERRGEADGPRVRPVDGPIPGLEPARPTIRERFRRLLGKGKA